MFDTLEADIVVMQEAKIQRKDLTDDMVLVPGWDVYFSLPKHKKGMFPGSEKSCMNYLTRPRLLGCCYLHSLLQVLSDSG